MRLKPNSGMLFVWAIDEIIEQSLRILLASILGQKEIFNYFNY